MVGWKIDGKTEIPGLVLRGDNKLYYPNPERGIPNDFPVTLETLKEHPGVALITAVDGRGTINGSPSYNKFLCYSFDAQKHLVTTYLAYIYTGPVTVRMWDRKKKREVETVNMFHLDITPDRIPDRVIQEHLRRISGCSCLVEGLIDLAEKCYSDMLLNAPQF